MILRPFDVGNWFTINNAVFDFIMPSLSPTAWKVLCVIIRATWGWAAAEGGRKTEDIISYSQFLERSGIGSDHTITAAISECIDAGYIMRREVARCRGTNRPIYVYALNIDFEIDLAATSAEKPVFENIQSLNIDSEIDLAATAKTAPTATAKTAPAATAKTAPAATAKTALTKRNKQTNDDGVVDLLLQQGIIEPVAREIANQGCTCKLVEKWLEYIRSQGGALTNPTAFLVSQLRLGKVPPTVTQPSNEDTEKRYRYIEGKYAHLIKH